ncbi:hypothetical protein WN71_001565 [Streptomyces mangrovisoli]|uniref:Uncharacterized protein n=1 Tax=Streptomyces mangrovisoli TaxID=1428628 RepID=A0A1J4P589_9ACTN|nr:hypothetical protein WN71_001565 [Streptomyces mangrovisoli]
MLAGLAHGDHLILERQGDGVAGDWYVQVLYRDDTYQLEHRDGVPAEHYQTRSGSREDVLRALLGWAGGERTWREGFAWENIGAWFAPPDAP